MPTKKLIQRNLPLSDKYTITGSNYVPLMDGQGTCCDNCGALISNMVYIQNENGEKFTVGNDCAKTLSTAGEYTLALMHMESAFNEGKTLRAKITSLTKKGKITDAYRYDCENGAFIIFKMTSGGSTMQKLYHPEISTTYVQDLLS